jgi:hypothetical protein
MREGSLLWRPRFLINLIVGQLCWQWSNHGQPGSPPRKLHQTTLLTPLTKLTHMCGQPVVNALVKPHLNLVTLDVFRNFCRVLQNSLKHLKSTFTKIVQFVERHNFHVDWHSKFWEEKGEKLDQLAVPPIHRHQLAFKVDKPSVQNLLRKTPYGLCESCRGSEIYNFCIQRFVHLYSKKWSFSI